MNDNKIKQLEGYIADCIIKKQSQLMTENYKNSYVDDVFGHIKSCVEPELENQIKSSIHQQKEELTKEQLIHLEKEIEALTEGFGDGVIKHLVSIGRLKSL